MKGIIQKRIRMYLGSTHKLIFLYGVCLGIIGFFITYDIILIDVTYDDWLMQDADPIIHYLGWKFYREAPWQFPLGLTDALVYPAQISILYTDSIPLFAFVFKIFSPILPATFQYFGLWGLMCFALHGGLGAIIIRKYTKSIALCLLSSVFFIFSPVVLQRLFTYYVYGHDTSHSALAGHWVILLAIIFWIYKDTLDTLKKQLLAWCILFWLCSLVQIYFLPMIAIIMMGNYLQTALKTKKARHLFIVPMVAMLSFFCSMYVAGGFYGDVSPSAFGFGLLNMNLNALFHPQGTSSLIMPNQLSYANYFQYEGYAYLGMGVFFLGICVFILVLKKIVQKKKAPFFECIINNVDVIFVIVCCTFLAINPVITFGQNTIFTINYPPILYILFSIFRTNGRFIWPVCYIIIIWLIKALINHGNKNTVFIIIILSVALHCVDFKNAILGRYHFYSIPIVYESPLKSNFWADNINFYSEFAFVRINRWRIAFPHIHIFASNNQMVINDSYLSRDYNNAVLASIEKNKQKVMDKDPSADRIIFLFYDIEEIEEEGYPLHYYFIDGYFIGLTQPIKNDYRYDEVIKIK